jgi:hypothetical protein
LRFAKDKDLPPANPGRNRDATENPFSWFRRIWHGRVLPGRDVVGKNESFSTTLRNAAADATFAAPNANRP